MISPPDSTAPGEPTSSKRRRGEGAWLSWPELVVAGAVAFGLVTYRAELSTVAYLNDSAIHEQMVRFSTLQIRAGHLPLEGWYPYLGLGSPQFMHYQSLGAMLTGAFGLAIGPDRAYPLSLYLLLCTFPIAVYLSARLFGFSRSVGALAGAGAPFIVSTIRVGFEQSAYLWVGFGVWAQLWAMWTLPLAWGFVWRALEDRRFIGPAALFVAATIAFHYEMGYLAVLALVILPFVVPTKLRRRLLHALVIAAETAALSAWVVYPLIHFANFTSINEFLQNGPDVNSYGARRVLSWLVTGHLFDQGRLPVLTVLVAVGLAVSLARFRLDANRRALVVLFVATTLVFFGRTTFGSLVDVIPGSRDLFLRRFIAGVQLSGILLVGVGAESVGRWMLAAARRIASRLPSRRPAVSVFAARCAVVALVVGYLAPAWTQASSAGSVDTSYIEAQRVADSTEGAQLDALIDRTEALGGGRVYAGMPTNWGEEFVVGSVPVLKYLAWMDVDEVGYTLRTASLMTDPEAYFNDQDPADFEIFGVRFLIYPVGRAPSAGAVRLEQRGAYVLWELPAVHYFQVVETSGSISADRADIGAKTAFLLDSGLASRGIYPTVAFDGARAAPATLRPGEEASGAGRVVSQNVDLAFGSASATVRMRRRGVVLLKVSYDPGWQVTVDGRRESTEMVVPALVGVTVGPGLHRVVFRYHSYGGYPVLFAIAGAAIVALLAVATFDRRSRRRRTKRRPPTEPSTFPQPESPRGNLGRSRSTPPVSSS